MATLYERAFQRLGLTDIGWPLGLSADKMVDADQARKRLVTKYGFAIPTSKVITRIKSLGPILEVGAGNGYWAYELRRAGADVVATDLQPDPGMNNYSFGKQWSPVEMAEASEAAKAHAKERALLIVWPCYTEDWAFKALRSYRKAGGTTLVYVGEREGGCTADDAFFRELKKHWCLDESRSGGLLSWPLIYDNIYVYYCP